MNGWGFFGGLLYAAAIFFGAIAVISGLVFGVTAVFSSPIISGLGGAAIGLAVGYMIFRERNFTIMVGTVTGICGLFLPWLISLFGGGLLAGIAGVLISTVATFIGCFIGLFCLPDKKTPEDGTPEN